MLKNSGVSTTAASQPVSMMPSHSALKRLEWVIASQFIQVISIPVDRHPQPVLQRGRGPKAQRLGGAIDVRHAPGNVLKVRPEDLRVRDESDGRGRSGCGAHLLGQIADARLDRLAEVE